MAHPDASASARTSAGNTDSQVGVTILVLVLAAGFGGTKWFQFNRDLDSIQYRAHDMLAYVHTLRSNMVKHDATSGHTVLLIRTPANDLALHFQALNGVAGRLEAIQTLPADSTAYQTALDDLRGVLREMPRIGSDLFWVRYGWWMAIVALVGWAVLAS
jgi:hypothetical protein